MPEFFLRSSHAAHAPMRALFLAIIIAALFVASQASKGQPATHPVNVTIQPTATALPVVVADKQGMFAKQGIEGKWSVSHVPISDSISALGRQFDVMMGTQPALIAASGQGIPIVAITGGALDTTQLPNTNVIAKAGSGITSFKQLEGKTVGTLSFTGNIHFSLLNVLQKQGVDLNSIHWVIGTNPQLPDLLKAGRVDAIEALEPFAGAAIAAGGIALGDPFRGIGDRAYVGYFLSQRDWANGNKDLVLKFSQALADAAAWIEENPADAKTILSSYSGLSGTALEKTPIPKFQISTTPKDLASELLPDLQTWNDILERTSDIKPVKANELVPDWAK
ncbi:MAG TPA: ABC transporter substrate-binding protein [Xanthobacteraceae bacterium]|jgi:NitT/TauT family transport system substrate-binding protein|nr:ABC transporter substrate-binding protein [Xanthobacteraceae bacterium]